MDKDELEKNFHLLNSGPARIAVGNNRNWWTVADKMEFNTRQQKLVNCFNLLEIMPDALPNVYADGTKTLGENTADLGGLLVGRQAYMEKLEREGTYMVALNISI